MPLQDIRLTPKNITKGLDLLRAMKSLKTIGIDYSQAWPAAEFWQRHDKGEFGKAAANSDPDRRAAEYASGPPEPTDEILPPAPAPPRGGRENATANLTARR